MQDSALQERSNRLDKAIERLDGNPMPGIQETTLPALERLKAETDDVYLSRDEIFEVSKDDFTSRFTAIINGRKDFNKVARGIVNGLSFEEIAKRFFDGDEIIAETWLNFLKLQIFEPEGVRVEEFIDENEARKFRLTEKRKRADKLEAEKEPPKFREVNLPDSRLKPLQYVATAQTLHLDIIKKMLGKTRANQEFTWPQTQRSLRVASRVLAERVEDEAKHTRKSKRERLSELEKEVWHSIVVKASQLIEDPESIQELSTDQIATIFRDYLTDAVDPRINPGILWPSDAPMHFDQPGGDEAVPVADFQKDVEAEKTEEQIDEPQDSEAEREYSITEEDFADISLALYRHRRIHINLDGQRLSFDVPDIIREMAHTYLNFYREDLVAPTPNPAAIDALSEKLKKTDSALEFIESQARAEVQFILYWLEENKAFIFDLLPHLHVKAEGYSSVNLSSQQLGEQKTLALLVEIAPHMIDGEPPTSDIEDEFADADADDLDNDEVTNAIAGKVEDENDDEDKENNDILDIKHEPTLEEIVSQKVKEVSKIGMFANSTSTYAQVTGAFRGVALADIRMAIQQGFIKHKRGNNQDDLTQADVAIVLVRKTMSNASFTARMKKQLRSLVEAELAKQADQANQQRSYNGK